MLPSLLFCLLPFLQFAQLIDASWFLPLQSAVSTVVVKDVGSFADCVALCKDGSDCQFVTYDYVAKTCTVRNNAAVVYMG